MGSRRLRLKSFRMLGIPIAEVAPRWSTVGTIMAPQGAWQPHWCVRACPRCWGAFQLS